MADDADPWARYDAAPRPKPRAEADPWARYDKGPAREETDPWARYDPKETIPGVAGREVARSIVPTLGGLAAGAGGAALAGAAGRALGGTLGGVLGGPVGAIGGGLLGGFAGQALGGAAQRALGLVDPAAEARDVRAHPDVAFAAGLAPQALAFRPGRALDLAGRAGQAAIMGGVEAGQQLFGEQPFDLGKIGLAAGSGAIFNKAWGLGRFLGGAAPEEAGPGAKGPPEPGALPPDAPEVWPGTRPPAAVTPGAEVPTPAMAREPPAASAGPGIGIRPERGMEAAPAAAPEQRFDLPGARRAAPAEAKALPAATIEPALRPAALGAAAATKEEAAALAGRGIITRFVLRALDAVDFRREGRVAAALTRASNAYDAAQARYGTADDAAAYGLREGDPQAQLTPGAEAIRQELAPIHRENDGLYAKIKALLNKQKQRADVDPELEQKIADLDTGYQHRRTKESVLRKLRESDDPVGGKRRPVVAPETKPRSFYAMEDEQTGTRFVVAKKGKEWWRASQYGPNLERRLERVKIPGTQVLRRGDSISLKDPRTGESRPHKIVDALTREIEDQFGVEYVKSAYHSAYQANIDLTRMLASLEAREEMFGTAKRFDVLSSTARPGFVQTAYPGFEDVYMHPRIAAALNRMSPTALRQSEDVIDTINRGVRIMNSTLFWNPFVHGANVFLHHAIERGFRWYDPAKYPAYIGFLKQATRDVSTMNSNYQNLIARGAALMRGPTRAHRNLTQRMYDHISEVRDTREGQTVLGKLAKMTGIRPDIFRNNLIKQLYDKSSDMMWQMGDILTEASILERQHYRGKDESLEESIRRAHFELPSYRIGSETFLPGKGGEHLSNLLRSPTLGLAVRFTRYHENILRSYVMMGEDIVDALRNTKDPNKVQNGIEALGKIVNTAAAFGILTAADKGLQALLKSGGMNPEDANKTIFRRFGPLAYLQLLLDAVSGKHLSSGSAFRAATGGFYTPSPLLEAGFNLAGRHAYTGGLIQPADKFAPPPHAMADVPWSSRLAEIGGAALAPEQQLRKIIESPATGLLGLTGLTSFDRPKEKPGKIKISPPKLPRMLQVP